MKQRHVAVVVVIPTVLVVLLLIAVLTGKHDASSSNKRATLVSPPSRVPGTVLFGGTEGGGKDNALLAPSRPPSGISPVTATAQSERNLLLNNNPRALQTETDTPPPFTTMIHFLFDYGFEPGTARDATVQEIDALLCQTNRFIADRVAASLAERGTNEEIEIVDWYIQWVFNETEALPMTLRFHADLRFADGKFVDKTVVFDSFVLTSDDVAAYIRDYVWQVDQTNVFYYAVKVDYRVRSVEPVPEAYRLKRSICEEDDDDETRPPNATITPSGTQIPVTTATPAVTSSPGTNVPGATNAPGTNAPAPGTSVSGGTEAPGTNAPASTPGETNVPATNAPNPSGGSGGIGPIGGFPPLGPIGNPNLNPINTPVPETPVETNAPSASETTTAPETTPPSSAPATNAPNPGGGGIGPIGGFPPLGPIGNPIGTPVPETPVETTSPSEATATNAPEPTTTAPSTKAPDTLGATTSAPGTPVATNAPDTPGGTSAPGTPDSTTAPDTPGGTSAPGSPGGTTSAPGTPESTSAPAPDSTTAPGTPDSTSAPDTPGATTAPDIPAAPGTPDSTLVPGPGVAAGTSPPTSAAPTASIPTETPGRPSASPTSAVPTPSTAPTPMPLVPVSYRMEFSWRDQEYIDREPTQQEINDMLCHTNLFMNERLKVAIDNEIVLSDITNVNWNQGLSGRPGEEVLMVRVNMTLTAVYGGLVELIPPNVVLAAMEESEVSLLEYLTDREGSGNIFATPEDHLFQHFSHMSLKDYPLDTVMEDPYQIPVVEECTENLQPPSTELLGERLDPAVVPNIPMVAETDNNNSDGTATPAENIPGETPSEAPGGSIPSETSGDNDVPSVAPEPSTTEPGDFSETGPGIPTGVGNDNPLQPPANDWPQRIDVSFIVSNLQFITIPAEVNRSGLSQSFPVFAEEVVRKISSGQQRYLRRRLEILQFEPDSAYVSQLIRTDCAESAHPDLVCHEAQAQYNLTVVDDGNSANALPPDWRNQYTSKTYQSIHDGTFSDILKPEVPYTPLFIGILPPDQAPDQTAFTDSWEFWLLIGIIAAMLVLACCLCLVLQRQKEKHREAMKETDEENAREPLHPQHHHHHRPNGPRRATDDTTPESDPLLNRNIGDEPDGDEGEFESELFNGIDNDKADDDFVDDYTDDANFVDEGAYDIFEDGHGEVGKNNKKPAPSAPLEDDVNERKNKPSVPPAPFENKKAALPDTDGTNDQGIHPPIVDGVKDRSAAPADGFQDEPVKEKYGGSSESMGLDDAKAEPDFEASVQLEEIFNLSGPLDSTIEYQRRQSEKQNKISPLPTVDEQSEQSEDMSRLDCNSTVSTSYDDKSVSKLRALCNERGINTDEMLEKKDMADALKNHKPNYEENSVKELRAMCKERGINTDGMLEKQDMVHALKNDDGSIVEDAENDQLDIALEAIEPPKTPVLIDVQSTDEEDKPVTFNEAISNEQSEAPKPRSADSWAGGIPTPEETESSCDSEPRSAGAWTGGLPTPDERSASTDYSTSSSAAKDDTNDCPSNNHVANSRNNNSDDAVSWEQYDTRGGYHDSDEAVAWDSYEPARGNYNDSDDAVAWNYSDDSAKSGCSSRSKKCSDEEENNGSSKSLEGALEDNNGAARSGDVNSNGSKNNSGTWKQYDATVKGLMSIGSSHHAKEEVISFDDSDDSDSESWDDYDHTDVMKVFDHSREMNVHVVVEEEDKAGRPSARDTMDRSTKSCGSSTDSFGDMRAYVVSGSPVNSYANINAERKGSSADSADATSDPDLNLGGNGGVGGSEDSSGGESSSSSFRSSSSSSSDSSSSSSDE